MNSNFRRLIKEASFSSVFVYFFKKLCFKYSFLKLSAYKVYEDSQVFRLIKILIEITKSTIKSSFLGRITELKERDNTALLNNSKFVKKVVGAYNKCMPTLKSYSVSSTAVNSEKEIREDFYLSPARTGSIIIISIILSHIVFAVLFKKKIGLVGSFLELIFLFIGVGGLFCNVNWEEVKKTSFILRHINR